MKVLKAILNTIINILIVIVLIVSLLIAVMALTSKATGISTVFGYAIQNIQSDSMKGGSPDGYEGGDFAQYDVLISKSSGFSADAEYEVGDIVTYMAETDQGELVPMVHRIVEKVKNDGGEYVYQTWGDNREMATVPDQEDVKDYLHSAQIGAVFYSDDYQGKIFKGVGKVLDFVQSQLGFFLVVLLPMIIFFMYELIRVVLNATNYKRVKSEEEKQQAVEEAVAVLRAEQEAASAAPAQMSEEELEQFRQFQAFKKMQEAQAAPPEPAEEPAAEEPEDKASLD